MEVHGEDTINVLDNQRLPPREKVLDAQEEYRRALVGVIKEVMHPPDFTDKNKDSSSRRMRRYAWCTQINKLLRNFISVTSRLAPADVPPSFEDVEVFVHDARQLSFTDEVPHFHDKWPKNLDEQVEEFFENGGEPLGKMMMGVANPVHSESETGFAGRGHGSVLGSAVRGYTSGRAAPSSGVSPPSPPRNALPITFPFTPQATPSLDSHFYNTSPQQSSSITPHPQTPSPSRRLSASDLEGSMRRKDPDGRSSRTSGMRGRRKPLRRNTITSSPAIQRIQESLETLDTTVSPIASCPPPPPSETPAPEVFGAGEGLVTSNPPRFSSQRSWIPQPYRDGSMTADVYDLYSRINVISEEADTLIAQAADIDARNEGEMRLKAWTTRARKCEESGRKVLTLIPLASRDLAKSSEVLWADSTLKLLKSAHVELMEYAKAMLESSRSNAPAAASSSRRTRSGIFDAQKARREAASNLQPPIRRWTESTGPSEPRETSTDATDHGPVRREVDRQNEIAGSSRASGRTRLIPYVLIPPVPRKRAPEPPRKPTPDPPPRAEPKSRILTKSIIIRSRQLDSTNDNANTGASSSCSGGIATYRTIKLQRMSDHVAGDQQLLPPCTECGSRGFSCFRRQGKEVACRRCQRVRKGHCTYARQTGRGVGASTSGAKTAKTKGDVVAGGKGKGKRKEVVRPKPTEKGALASASNTSEKGAETRNKRLMPRRGSDALKKLKEAREMMEKERRRRIATGESEEDSETEEEGSSAVEETGDESESDSGAPPLKRRRRSPSPQATYDDLYLDIDSGHADIPVQVTSDTPENRDVLMQGNRSKRPTLRLESLVRAQTSTTEQNSGSDVASNPPRAQSGGGSGEADVDSQSTMKSVGPDAEPMIQVVRESPGIRAQNEDMRMVSQDAQERGRSASRMEVDDEHTHLETEDPELDHRSTASELTSLVSETPITPTAPPPATLATGGISILTPTSLTASSPQGTHAHLPSIPLSFTSASLALQSHLDPHRQGQPQQHPHQQHEQNRIELLRAKLDALLAAHAALSTEVESKVGHLAGQIAVVSEELRILESAENAPGPAPFTSTEGMSASLDTRGAVEH